MKPASIVAFYQFDYPQGSSFQLGLVLGFWAGDKLLIGTLALVITLVAEPFMSSLSKRLCVTVVVVRTYIGSFSAQCHCVSIWKPARLR